MGQVTIAGTTYEVYGDETGLKQYLSAKLSATSYAEASGTDRKKAHVSATRWVDRERWSGEPTDTVTPQPLKWPRTGASCNGILVDSASVPDAVVQATYELVEILLSDPTAATAATQGTNEKKYKAGSVEIEFFKSGAADGSGQNAGLFPVEAQKLLRCFLVGSALGSVQAFGTGECSEFTDTPDRREPLA